MQNKKIRLKDKLLLGLALTSAFMEEFRDPGGFVSFSYEQMYGFAPRKYKKHNFNVLVNRLSKTKDISKTVKDGKAYFTLSDYKGILIKRFPLVSLRDSWDGKFQVVIFDIEEINKKRRNFLRGKLKELGFGMWQRSVWISPLPIKDKLRDFLKEQGLFGTVCVFTVGKEDCGNLRDFADRIWKIEEINNEYKDWIESFKKAKEKGDSATLRDEFWKILLNDPFLPEDFLPHDWAGKEALALLKQ